MIKIIKSVTILFFLKRKAKWNKQFNKNYMTTHIIINAATDVAKLIGHFRTSQSKLSLQLGEYVLTNNDQSPYFQFIPGIDKRNFSCLLWLLESYPDWSRIEDWSQDIEFFWTDPALLSSIREQKQEQTYLAKHASTKGIAIPMGPPPLPSKIETFPTAGEHPPIPSEELVYIKGILHDNGEEDMEYEENLGIEHQSHLFCPERKYSFQVITKNERPFNASLAERVHLYPVNYISIKRSYTFRYQDSYAYKFTVAKTGRFSKHETVAEGVLSYHVSILLNRNQRLLDTKNNLKLAGDLCEKAIDLLGRTLPYSLEVLHPHTNFPAVLAKRPIEFQDTEEDSTTTTSSSSLTHQKVPTEFIPFLT